MDFAPDIPPVPGDLDAFLMEGDDQTWSLDDWHWDPAQLSAAPREVPTLRCCQAFKRQQLVQGSSKAATDDLAHLHASGSATPGHMEGCMAPGGATMLPASSAVECTLSDKWSPSAYLNMMIAATSDDGGGAATSVDMASGHPHFLQPPLTPFTMGVPLPMALPQTGAALSWPAGGAWAALSQQQQQADPLRTAGQVFNGSAGHIMATAAGSDGDNTSWMNSFYQQGPAPTGGHQAHANLDMFAASAAAPPFAQSEPAAAGVMQHQGCCARPPAGSGCSSRQAVGPVATPPSQRSTMSTLMPAFAVPPSRGFGAGGAAGRGRTSPFAAVPASLASVLVKPRMSAVEGAEEAGSDGSDDNDDDGRSSVAPGQSRRYGSSGAAVPATYTGDLADVAVMLPQDETGGTLTCQVAGCGQDLTGLKEWCQRCRICEVHVRLPQVLRDGQLQRFCQQCGRFHELSAFDVNRKSCREQLGKHNARRRRQKLQAKSKAAQAAVPGSSSALPEAVSTVPAPAASTAVGADGLNPLVSALLADPLQLQALRRALALPTHPALPTLQPYRPPGQGSGECVDPPSYGLARSIQDGRGEFAPTYESNHCMLRISAKLFGKTPADLPHDLRQQVTGWLSSAPVGIEGAIRPGCVFLTLQLLVDQPTYAAAAASGVQGLLDHLLNRTGCPFWHDGSFSIQVFGGVSVVSCGTVVSVAEVDVRRGTVAGSGSLYPALNGARNAAPGGGWALLGGQAADVVIQGVQLDAPGTEVICRYGGRQLRPAWERSSPTSAVVHLPALGPGNGVVWLELARGGYLSAACPLLVADDPTLVEEVGRLGAASPVIRTRQQLEGLLVDVALVLRSSAGAGPQGPAAPAVACQMPTVELAVKARRMLALAFDLGWAGMASRLLPLASAGCCNAAEAVAAVEAACAASNPAHASCPPCTRGDVLSGLACAAVPPAAGLSLLHRAVRGGSVPLLSGVLAWGKQHGVWWRPDMAGPGAVTPLHLAALLEQPVIALMLLDHMADGLTAGGHPVESALTALAAPDGVTPFHLAFQMGYWTLDQKFLSHLLGPPTAQQQYLAKQAAFGGAKRTASSSSSLCRGQSSVAKRTAGQDALWRAATDVPIGGKRDGQADKSSVGVDEDDAGVDPCTVCRSTVAPLVLSVTAACTDCGQRQPCLNEQGCGRGVPPGGPAGRGGTTRARDTSASGVLTKQSDKMVAGTSIRHHNCVQSARTSSGTSHHLSLFDDLRSEAAGFVMRQRPSGTAAVSCQHRHGPSYSITAICQSCHANRVLAVA